MIKNCVLDTNVLLHDPNALRAFEENDIVIPIYVIEEIDKFKREMSELGRSARSISRTLDAILHEYEELHIKRIRRPGKKRKVQAAPSKRKAS